MTTFKANRKFPNPITVTDDPKSHTIALQQIIEALSIGQRRTKEVQSSYVRVHELVDVGLIEVVGNQLKLTNAGAAAVAAGATALADLTDVNLTGLTDGDTLVWDAGTSKWIPGAAASGPITGADMYDVSLNDLADVGFSNPQDGDALTYDAASGLWTTGQATYSPVNDGCAVKRTGSAQAITQNTYVAIQFDTEVRDDNNYWTSTANTKFTAPETGWYYVGASVVWDSNTGGSLRLLRVGVNGTINSHATGRLDSAGNVGAHVSEAVFLNRGDYVEFFVYTDAVGTSLYTPSDGNYPIGWIHRLGVSQSPSSPQNSGAEVSSTASQSIPNTTVTAVTFDTEVRDDSGYWNSAQPTRLTAPSSGWYIVTGGLQWAANASGTRRIYIRRNGSDARVTEIELPASGVTSDQSIQTLVYLSAGDYVELTCSQSSGGALNINANSSHFEIHRLGVPNTTATQPVNDGAAIARTTDFTVTNGAFRLITFDTELRDDNGYYSSLANDRFTVPAAGWYAISMTCQWDTTSSTRGVWITKNTDPNTAANIIASSYTVFTWAKRDNVSGIAYLNAGDTVYFYAYSDSTTTIKGTTQQVYASIHRLGASSSPGNPQNDGAWVYRAASPPSIAHNTVTDLTFDTEVRDDGSYANLVASNDRVVIPRAGWYSIFGAFQWDAIGTGFICSGYISINGATQIQQLLPSVNNLTNHMSGLLYLNAGDVVKLQAYQTSGVSKSLICSGGMPTLRVHRLGVPESVETVNDQFFDAASRFEHYDDFISRDNVGDQGYGTGTANGGSVTQGSLNKHPGIISCATSANNAGYGILNLSPAGGSIFSAEQLFFTPTGTDELYFEALIRVNALFNASPNPGAYRIGFIDQVTSYGQYAYCDFGNGGAVFGTKGSGGSQSGNFSTNLTANTWHRLKIKLTATSAQAWLDDVLQVTHTDATKFATAGFTAFFFVQNQGGTGVNHVLDVDYVRIWGTSTRN